MPTVKKDQNSSTKEIVVHCPNCQKQVTWNAQQKSKPFCSERCKLIDLGEWAAEEKTIPGESIDPQSVEFDLLLR